MNASPENDLPLYDPEDQSSYTLEVVAELTGISSQTILYYQAQGMIEPTDLDDEAIHTLRRIEHLRSTCETNLSGLKLILDLMDEVDRLKTELRARQ